MRFNVTATVQQEDNWYVAKCVDTHVASQGKSIEEALNNLKEALELYFEDRTDSPAIRQTFITTLEIAI